MNAKKGIAILGSTGSIGTQALEVVDANPELFSVEILTAHANSDLLIQQALKYKPNAVVIVDESKYQVVNEVLFDAGIKVFAGAKSLEDVVTFPSVQTVLTAMVGYSGLAPTLAAIDAGKDIALANKETLVVAGEIITQEARKKGVNIYPVDSEHSAIFQCLVGEFQNPIEKIILTASGGPFRGWSKSKLQAVTPAQALKHPNWDMGAKITIDSSTLMNKGLEVIEAKWLFAVKPEQIEVVVHPQSIIHSMVQFQDGSIKAQLGLPDMRLPIQFALLYPNRGVNAFPRFDFTKINTFTFEQPDKEAFPCLQLAFDALNLGGTAACALNAANEVTVAQFLKGNINYLDIPRINEATMHGATFIKKPTISDYIQLDSEARIIATEACLSAAKK